MGEHLGDIEGVVSSILTAPTTLNKCKQGKNSRLYVYEVSLNGFNEANIVQQATLELSCIRISE